MSDELKTKDNLLLTHYSLLITFFSSVVNCSLNIRHSNFRLSHYSKINSLDIHLAACCNRISSHRS